MQGNKKMTLTDARSELERRGFVVHQEEEAASLAAVCSGCLWEFMARFEVMVFVHALAPGQNLTLARIRQDLDALPRHIHRLYPGGCPPFGFGRARMTVVVYLLDNDGGGGGRGAIQADAMERIHATPDMERCALTFLAAQDAEGTSHFMESHTPFWGKALYPLTRYYAGLLTGRDVPEQPPAPPTFYKWLTFILIPLILFQFWLGPKFLWLFGGWLLLRFVVAMIFAWRDEQQRHASSREDSLLQNQELLVL